VQAMLKPLSIYDSEADGATTVNLSQKQKQEQEQRQAELKAGLDALNVPNGGGCPGKPFATFDAIDNYYWNAGRGDHVIGKADIDKYLDAWSWGNPIPESDRKR